MLLLGTRGPTPGATRERRIRYSKELLQKDFLPHVGVNEFCETKKAYFFGYMLHRLLLAALGRREVRPQWLLSFLVVLELLISRVPDSLFSWSEVLAAHSRGKNLITSVGPLQCDDRDHYGNKRMDLAGMLLAQLFRMLFAKMTKELQRAIQKAIEKGKEFNLGHALNTHIIAGGLKYSLATGTYAWLFK